MYMLDTNVISELRSNKKNQSLAVRNWAANQDFQYLYLSAVTIFEIEHGILSLDRRTPPEGATLRSWFTGVQNESKGKIFPFTQTTAMIYATFPAASNGAIHDFMIAATAIEHGFTVVTRNTQDFELTGVKLLNPWLRSA